jgi:hypothetical protein
MSVSQPSSIRPFFIFKPRHHAFPNASSSKRETALLSNDNVLPTAVVFTECFEEKPLAEWCSPTKLGPQVSNFPAPILVINIAMGSSPSEDRSVDFLHSTHRVVSQARLLNSMYYSRMDFTYKLDRTTVTVGAPSMLEMSTSPASVGASSSTCAATGSSAPVVALGSGLLSTAGTYGSTTLAVRCVSCDTRSSTVGAGLRLLSVGLPTVSQSSPSPRSTGSDDGISCDNSEFKLSAYNTSRQVLDYSTRGTYLLGRRLCHLQLLGDTFACHIAHLPLRCRETSLQASWWIHDKGDIGQPRSAEPGPQLKSLLQRFPVLLIGRIFNGDGIVTFANFTVFFGLALALL